MGNDKKREIAVKYAWDWFSYHAAQRLTAFRFFLVIVGIVGAGYFRCVEQGLRFHGTIVALFGALISIAFWFLDIRNTELVNCGRAELDELEREIRSTIRQNDQMRIFFGRSLDRFSRFIFRHHENQPPPDIQRAWRYRSTKHGFWFRFIEGFTFVVFIALAGAIWVDVLVKPKESVPLKVEMTRDIIEGFLNRIENFRKQEKTRIIAEDLLNHVDHLHKMVEDLLGQPSFTARVSEDLGIKVKVKVKVKAKAMLILADEVSSQCRKQPFVEAPCKEFQEWIDLAAPLLEEIANSQKAAELLRSIPENQSKDLRDRLKAFASNLKKIVETSY